jgi:TolB protein
MNADRLTRRRFLGLALAVAASAPLAGCQAVPRALAQPGLLPLAELVVSGRIVYVKRGDIWRWSSDKTQQVTRGNRYEGASYSPSSKQIAASFMGVNHSDVVIVSETGQLVAQVTKNLSNQSVKAQAWGRKPVWSPDGARLAYISDQGPMTGEMKSLDMSLFVIDADGSDLHKLIVEKPFSGGVDWPTWSPDGKRIAYVAFDSGPSQIQVYNTTTSEWKTLTNHAEGAYDPAFSPDGNYIAYAVRENGKNDIYLMRADGTEPVRLTDSGANRAPCWSPDGQLLAYVSDQSGTFEIVVAKVNSSDRLSLGDTRQLTKGEDVEAASGISWAP